MHIELEMEEYCSDRLQKQFSFAEICVYKCM